MSLVKLSPVLRALGSLWQSPPELPRPLKLERRLIVGRWVGVAAGMRVGFARGMLLAVGIILIDGTSTLAEGNAVGPAYIVRSGMLVLTVILTSFLYDEAKKAESAMAERLHQSEVLNGALE